MLCWAHAGLEMLRSALVSLMFLKAMLHVQFTAAGSLCYDKRFCHHTCYDMTRLLKEQLHQGPVEYSGCVFAVALHGIN